MRWKKLGARERGNLERWEHPEVIGAREKIERGSLKIGRTIGILRRWKKKLGARERGDLERK